MQLAQGITPGMSSGRRVSVVEVEVRPGENHIEVTVPTLYPLRVHWADAEVGNSLSLTRLDAELGEPTHFGSPALDQFGIAEWMDLPPGRYMLSPGSPPGQMMEITVPSSEIEFVPKAINAVRFTVTDPAGDLAEAGIQTGDLLVGYEGKLFDDQAQLQLFLSALAHKATELSFTVRSGNRDLTMTVSGAEIGLADQWGVALVPTARE
ncbi:MAG: hypothetical protein GY930_06490 [bacterium]|nr:hypothetical protein [bacterium]